MMLEFISFSSGRQIIRMEMQQQQHQLISMESLDHSGFRNIAIKCINVLLAMLAVILVVLSAAANLLSPFNTKYVPSPHYKSASKVHVYSQ